MTRPRTGRIRLALQADDDAFRLAGPTAASVRVLDAAAWQTIIERASMLPRTGKLRFTVAVPAADLPRARGLPAAIHGYFGSRRASTEHELQRTVHAGWMSLLVGSLLLALVLSLSHAIGRVVPPNGLSVAIREGLTIVGWVALWRPAELLLYSPWPLRRDIALFGRLEHADVSVEASTHHDDRYLSP